jgi:cullin-associated NEDD8-dissociated protein 1
MYNRYTVIILRNSVMQSTSFISLVNILSNARPAVRKRAIPALSALVSCSSPELFYSVLQGEIITGLETAGEASKTWVGVLASLAKGQSAPRVGELIGQGKVMETIIQHTENVEDSEAVEGALTVSVREDLADIQAIEVFILKCPAEISPYIASINAKALELVRYDPVCSGL